MAKKKTQVRVNDPAKFLEVIGEILISVANLLADIRMSLEKDAAEEKLEAS